MALIINDRDAASRPDKREMIQRMNDDSLLWIEMNLQICMKEGELVPFIRNSFQWKPGAAVMDSAGKDGDLRWEKILR
jgi:hypothetical protein